MKEITKDNTVTLVTVVPGELLIAPTDLRYDLMVGDTKEQLVFKGGIMKFDKAEKSALYETIKAKIDDQYEKDANGNYKLDPQGNKVIRGDRMKLPFMLMEDFEETLAKLPVRVPIPDGQGGNTYIELTPEEVADLYLKKSSNATPPNTKEAKKEAKKGDA